MTPGTWQNAVTRLLDASRDATSEQLTLARQVGVSITEKTPALIAAAILRVALSKQLLIEIDGRISEYARTVIKSLRSETVLSVKPANEEEARAWMDYLRLLRRLRRLKSLKPEKGDIVKLTDGDKVEVSSVDADGRVYFKGGGATVRGLT